MYFYVELLGVQTGCMLKNFTQCGISYQQVIFCLIKILQWLNIILIGREVNSI